MSEQTHFIPSKDGLQLYIRHWAMSDMTSARGVIALIHGFGEHIGRYHHVATFFNTNGYAFIGMDNRGHGQSGGKRGHTPQYDNFLDDVDVFLADVKRLYPTQPLFLYGHSMGGGIVLNYLLKRTATLSGAVVTGPLIRLAFEPKPILLALGKLMRSIYPSFSQSSDLVADHISKDPSVVAAYKSDPLVHRSITASAGLGLTEAGAWLDAYAGELKTPLLIMHAEEDKLTSQAASEAFGKRVRGDITYKKWVGMYHEIHNEPDKMQVLTYMLAWVDSHN